jgi:bifunctional DNA-binding transcriptional regulator/antitoxin component of YhaV-PrlF toxin-antitoxin module
MAMSTVWYDGWVMLPPALRARLGVRTGDHVELTPVDGGVLLRRWTLDAAPTPAMAGRPPAGRGRPRGSRPRA